MQRQYVRDLTAALPCPSGSGDVCARRSVCRSRATDGARTTPRPYATRCQSAAHPDRSGRRATRRRFVRAIERGRRPRCRAGYHRDVLVRCAAKPPHGLCSSTLPAIEASAAVIGRTCLPLNRAGRCRCAKNIAGWFPRRIRLCPINGGHDVTCSSSIRPRGLSLLWRGERLQLADASRARPLQHARGGARVPLLRSRLCRPGDVQPAHQSMAQSVDCKRCDNRDCRDPGTPTYATSGGFDSDRRGGVSSAPGGSLSRAISAADIPIYNRHPYRRDRRKVHWTIGADLAA